MKPAISKGKDILGYYFAIVVEKGDEWGFVATCPGVGGVYEEGETQQQAIDNAIKAACAIFSARKKTGVILTKDGPYLKVIHQLGGI